MHTGVAVTLDHVQLNRQAQPRGNHEAELSRVAPGCLGVAADALDLRFRILDRHIHAKPAVTHLSYALERRCALPTEEDRWMGFLHRLGVQTDLRKAAELACELRLFLGPQQLHRLEISPGTLGSPLPRHADRGELFSQPAHAYTKVKPATGEFVQARDLFGRNYRATLGHETDAGAKPEGLGVRSGKGEGDKGIKNIDLGRHRQFAVLGVRVS